MHDTILKSIKPITTQATWDKRFKRPRISDHDLNPDPEQTLPPPASLTPAAVLVPLVERPEGLHVLLTLRTDHLYDHAGQVSFPGGRAEDGDQCPVDTALRETHEEIGLDQPFIQVAGYLDDYETVTGFRVTPVVGFVRDGFTLSVDEFEVAEVFEVPLTFILDARNHQIHSRMRHGRRRSYHVFQYGERYIWGATAGMLMNLYRRVSANI